MRHVVKLIVVAVLTSGSVLAFQQNIYRRPTIANVIITGSKNLFDGTYVTNGTSSICGEIPKASSLTGVDTFVIEFTGNSPSNAADVLSIAFGSNALVRGVTKSPLFRLTVSVRTSQGGQPPAYVLNTDSKQLGASGLATLTYKGNTAILQVNGTNEMNQTITAVVSCAER